MPPARRAARSTPSWCARRRSPTAWAAKSRGPTCPDATSWSSRTPPPPAARPWPLSRACATPAAMWSPWPSSWTAIPDRRNASKPKPGCRTSSPSARTNWASSPPLVPGGTAGGRPRGVGFRGFRVCLRVRVRRGEARGVRGADRRLLHQRDAHTCLVEVDLELGPHRPGHRPLLQRLGAEDQADGHGLPAEVLHAPDLRVIQDLMRPLRVLLQLPRRGHDRLG